jgi:hypothetical protein
MFKPEFFLKGYLTMPRYFLLFCVALFLNISCAKHDEPTYKLDAVKAEDSITIDGMLDEAAWQAASKIELKNNKTGTAVTDQKLQTTAMTCYSDSVFYIAFVCNDPDSWANFSQRDDHLWEEEAVEVFIDTDEEPNTYVEIEVSPKNILFDSYIVDPFNINLVETPKFTLAGIQTAVSVDGTVSKRADVDSFWTVEIAIPVHELDKAGISPGKTKRKINFYRIEEPKDGEVQHYAWSPTEARFHKPSVFGTLNFAH